MAADYNCGGGGMIDITLLLIIVLILSFWGAFGWLFKSWWNDRKAEKEFEKRQERYRKMI